MEGQLILSNRTTDRIPGIPGGHCHNLPAERWAATNLAVQSVPTPSEPHQSSESLSTPSAFPHCAGSSIINHPSQFLLLTRTCCSHWQTLWLSTVTLLSKSAVIRSWNLDWELRSWLGSSSTASTPCNSYRTCPTSLFQAQLCRQLLLFHPKTLRLKKIEKHSVTRLSSSLHSLLSTIIIHHSTITRLARKGLNIWGIRPPTLPSLTQPPQFL